VALEQASAAAGTLSNRIGLAQLALARALRAQARHAEARVASAQARQHLEASLGVGHPDTKAARELELAAVPGR